MQFYAQNVLSAQKKAWVRETIFWVFLGVRETVFGVFLWLREKVRGVFRGVLTPHDMK